MIALEDKFEGLFGMPTSHKLIQIPVKSDIPADEVMVETEESSGLGKVLLIAVIITVSVITVVRIANYLEEQEKSKK